MKRLTLCITALVFSIGTLFDIEAQANPTFRNGGPVFSSSGGLRLAVAAVSDTTPPNLSSPAASATGSTTATATVSTDEGNGTLYCLVSTNTSETASTVKGSSNNQPISSTGTKTCNPVTGLTPSTVYYAHFVHRDAAGNDSSVVRSASFTTSAGSGSVDITLAFTASRTSNCAAPCSVTFDATATTATSTTRPYHDIRYTWNFGDSVGGPASSCGTTISAGEGFWACGRGAGSLSKNVAEGPVTAHVYENPGSYQVCLTGQNSTGTSTPLCQTITVVDATTTTWAGTNTTCLSSTGDFTGCPVGAVTVNVGTASVHTAFNSAIGNGKRVLFRRGDTFNLGGQMNLTAVGPWLVGAYGSGAKPIIAVTTNDLVMFNWDSPSWPTTSTTDGRIMDLDLRGTGFTGTTGFATSGTFSKMLVLRVDFATMKKAITTPAGVVASRILAVNEPIYNNLVVQDCRVVGLVTDPVVNAQNGEIGFLFSVDTVHAMGLYINNLGLGEHGIRTQYTPRSSFTNMTIMGIAPGKVPITTRGGSPGDPGLDAVPIPVVQYEVIADNNIVGSPSSGMISVGPQNGNFAERGADVLIERNYLDASGGGGTIGILWPDVTVRNNLARQMGTLAIVGWDDNTGNLPTPTRVNFYNNSSYSTTTSPGTSYILFAGGGNAALNSTGTTFAIQNNVRYLPNTSGPLTFDITGGGWGSATITATNNTSSVSTSPNWTTTLPTSAAGFKPLAGSYAIGAGVAIPGVLYDFFGVARTSPPDMGAVQH